MPANANGISPYISSCIAYEIQPDGTRRCITAGGGGGGAGGGGGGGGNGGGPPPPPAPDPWARLADVLAGFGGGGLIVPPQPEQAVTYVPTGAGVSPMAIVLLVGAVAGGAYWWWRRTKS